MPAAVVGVGDVTGSLDDPGRAAAGDAETAARVASAAATVRRTCTAGQIEKGDVVSVTFVSTSVGKPS
jgi:hypothetical protein